MYTYICLYICIHIQNCAHQTHRAIAVGHTGTNSQKISFLAIFYNVENCGQIPISQLVTKFGNEPTVGNLYLDENHGSLSGYMMYVCDCVYMDNCDDNQANFYTAFIEVERERERDIYICVYIYIYMYIYIYIYVYIYIYICINI